MAARNGCTNVRFVRRALTWDRVFHVKHKQKGSTVETCEDVVECPMCGDELSEGEGYVVDDTNYLPYNVRRSHGEGQYCTDCLTMCVNCDHYVDSDNVMFDPNNGESHCSDCWFEYWTCCDQCGDTMSHEHSYFDERVGATVCEDCYQPESEGRDGLSVHTCPTCHTPNVHFHLLSERYVCDCVAATVPVAYIVRTNTLQNA